MEPGPAFDLFARHKESGRTLASEWDLMKALRRKGALGEIWEHRETYITRRDFAQIAGCGLNAVRLPFGYWVVLGGAKGEPYEGPALEYIDRAVAWAEEFGLQVLLDLHGAPGGESADAPCGRTQRPGQWHWSDWNFSESLKALEVVAKRYKDCKAVTGIGVCNEPSNKVPLSKLCHFYDRAVRRVRAAGMPAERVAVTLPAFQRPLRDVAAMWDSITGGQHANVCFDLHYYHCFGDDWNGKTLAQNLRAVKENADELARFPAVVSEWSLALGGVAKLGAREDRETRALFGAAQFAAYRAASHGWFFWNWKDGNGVEWSWQDSFQEGSLQRDAEVPKLPAWSGEGEDPLEEILNPSPADPEIHYGDTVFLRSFRGTYLDVQGSSVRARWASKGEWQRVTLCPPPGYKGPNPNENAPRAIRSGSVVRLLAHTGQLLAVKGAELTTCPADEGHAGADFVVHMKRAGKGLKHRSAVFLQSRTTRRVLDVGAGDDTVRARWRDFGEWQGFALEKASQNDDEEMQPAAPSPLVLIKRRRSFKCEVSPPPSAKRLRAGRGLGGSPARTPERRWRAGPNASEQGMATTPRKLQRSRTFSEAEMVKVEVQ